MLGEGCWAAMIVKSKLESLLVSAELGCFAYQVLQFGFFHALPSVARMKNAPREEFYSIGLVFTHNSSQS